MLFLLVLLLPLSYIKFPICTGLILVSLFLISLFVYLGQYLMVLNNAAPYYCLVSGKMVHHLLLFFLVTLAKGLDSCILPLTSVSIGYRLPSKKEGPASQGISGKVAPQVQKQSSGKMCSCPPLAANTHSSGRRCPGLAEGIWVGGGTLTVSSTGLKKK